MAPGSRMCRIQLWLLIFLIVSLSTLADGSPLKVMSAPNVLRVGTEENIFVECQDCTGGDIRVEISVMNHPTKTTTLASTSVTLTSANHFQNLGQIKIPATVFSKDPNDRQYVYLQAQFPDKVLKKVVLVSFQSGYIFIQTDKPVYTPNSRFLYRLFAVTPHMEPVQRDGGNDAIVIEIVTPELIINHVDTVTLNSEFHSGSYQLSENASPGLWKVVAKFLHTPQQSFSAEFEVGEYVLRSFEVKLTPMDPFFYVDSDELIIKIKATYLIQQEVDGVAYVIFGVIQEGQKKSFPSSVQSVPIQSGSGQVKLKREHILQTFRNILHLVGSSIFVAVSVLTDNGSEMVEAELRGIQIVTSPYVIHFKKTPNYFKPGIPFDVVVDVVNPDGTPAQGVAVVVNPGQMMGFTAANGMAKLSITTEASSNTLTITARTDDPRITRDRQASATMVALPYTTGSKNYIHIVVSTPEVTLGDHLKISLFTTQQNAQNDVTYLILSRGQLVTFGRAKGRLTVKALLITKELLPSFRIIAYYHTNGDEVVSDSVWLDVQDSCMGSLQLEPVRYVGSYAPRRSFRLKVTGDPEAKVGFIAVDKNNFIMNKKYRLTQKKVWDLVDKFDTGCTPGGGKDSMSVFYDAGLLFESSLSGTPHRQDMKCPVPSRRKRSSTIRDKRSEVDDNSYMDNSEIVSRSKFPESWLWFDLKLPPCPQQTPNCGSTSFVKTMILADSLTTWQFTGISLSRTHGICVAEPLEVIVQKDFFIDLRLPYSAVRGEQLELKAIIHNYSPDHVTVRVDLLETVHVCSVAYGRGKYRQEVRIGPQSKQSVPFIIVPMKEGQHRIEVKAAVKDTFINDGIMKILHVVPAGVLVKATSIITLNPVKQGLGGKQEGIINSQIPLSRLAPNTPQSTLIYVTGSEQVGATVEDAINGASMGSLIYQPSGNGEANMIHMAQTVITTMYLDKTNQWETVGFDKRDEALNYIKAGYQNELAYCKNDGSFAVLPSHQSSTWLTAYVAKVFSMAYNLVPIESSYICNAVKFLILHAQQANGMFRENGHLLHTAMHGDVQGRDSDASMTAFCLIAMQESRKICSSTVHSLPGSIHKAMAYLETRLPSLTNPYAVAMVSYALANGDKLNKEILYKFVSSDLSHWPVSEKSVYTLEATAYALLALVKAKAFEEARPVVRWFNQQQKVGGGYGSTQATIMVYQAVAEYWANVKEQEFDLNVDILVPGRSRPEKYFFHNENQHITRTVKFDGINMDVKVTAMGTGEVTLKMVSMYYTLATENESNCNKFNLSVQLIPENTDQNEKVYKVRIEVLYKDTVRDASMAILDIGLLTGFTLNTHDLNLLSRTKTVRLENGSLIINLDKVSRTQPEVIVFRIHQTLNVEVLQPAAVSVYEYNESTHCVRFYHPERTGGQLLRFCINDECTCAEENCGMQKKGNINTNERSAKAIEVSPYARTDYVYKVRVEEFTSSLPFDIYKMRIVGVIKKGNTDVVSQDQLRNFVSPQHCRAALDLRVGKTYLIMGTPEYIQEVGQSQSYQYVLGEKTWIEYWPTVAECQTVQHRPTCLDMEMLVSYLVFFC